MSPEFIFGEVTEEEYRTAGSKFVTFPPAAKVGDPLFRDIEIEKVDWDTPGHSMGIHVSVTEEGIDKGKRDKVSFGVKREGIWKGRELYKAITGEEMPMKKGGDGQDHPSIDPAVLLGQPAVGFWQWTEGKKGGVGEPVQYPKLMGILPAGEKPTTESLGY